MKTAKEILRSRNPWPEINLDTGEDMFGATMLLCMKEYALEVLNAVCIHIVNEQDSRLDRNTDSVYLGGGETAFTNVPKLIKQIEQQWK